MPQFQVHFWWQALYFVDLSKEIFETLVKPSLSGFQ
jgi:hypothetical protein